MHALKTSFNSNPNIGLYGIATDEYCLLGLDVPKKSAEKISKTLEVPIYRLNICGTSLWGVFCAANNNCLLVPSIAFDSELRALKKLGINYKVIRTKQTALGNNILCNNTGCLVNPEFSADTKKEIRLALNVKLRPGTIAGLEHVGALGAVNQTAGVVHQDVTKEEIEYLGDALEIDISTGTISFGTPYIRSGLLVNSKGFAISSSSTPIEIQNVYDTFKNK